MILHRMKYETLLKSDAVNGLSVFPDMSNPAMNHQEINSFYDAYAVMPVQTHSCNVKVIGKCDEIQEDTDALVTFEDSLTIGVRTADCVPVLMYAPDVKGVAAVHAGWKGTLGGIVDNTLDVLMKKGADLSRLLVAFGPSISKAAYEVDEDLAARFASAGFSELIYYPDAAAKPHIDLQGVNTARLINRGVSAENIHLHSGCTMLSSRDNFPLYPSYRRSCRSPLRLLTCITLLS